MNNAQARSVWVTSQSLTGLTLDKLTIRHTAAVFDAVARRAVVLIQTFDTMTGTEHAERTVQWAIRSHPTFPALVVEVDPPGTERSPGRAVAFRQTLNTPTAWSEWLADRAMGGAVAVFGTLKASPDYAVLTIPKKTVGVVITLETMSSTTTPPIKARSLESRPRAVLPILAAERRLIARLRHPDVRTKDGCHVAHMCVRRAMIIWLNYRRFLAVACGLNQHEQRKTYSFCSKTHAALNPPSQGL